MGREEHEPPREALGRQRLARLGEASGRCGSSKCSGDFAAEGHSPALPPAQRSKKQATDLHDRTWPKLQTWISRLLVTGAHAFLLVTENSPVLKWCFH